MIFRRLIIPFVVYGLVLFSGLAFQRATGDRIAKMINEAGREGKPVVMSSGIRGTQSQFRLHSIDDPSEPVILPNVHQYEVASSFAADGSYDYMVWVWKDNVTASTLLNTIVLPDARIEASPQLDYGAGTGMMDDPFPIERQYYTLGGTWIMTKGGDRLELRNAKRDVVREMPLESIPEKVKDSPGMGSFRAAISPDGDVLIWVQVSNHGLNEVWRCDLDGESWTDLGRVAEIKNVVVGPHGDKVGYENMGKSPAGPIPTVDFVDGRTWSTIVSISNARRPVIGNRWAACLAEWHNGSLYIKVFDMSDGWKEYEMDLSGKPNQRSSSKETPAISIYEPPANGIDGMYENYKPQP